MLHKGPKKKKHQTVKMQRDLQRFVTIVYSKTQPGRVMSRYFHESWAKFKMWLGKRDTAEKSLTYDKSLRMTVHKQRW